MALKIVETSLRDGHQSLFATRMNTEEVLSVLKELDDAGYHAIEVWGGATFDACIRFLNEDPWERLRKAKALCKSRASTKASPSRVSMNSTASSGFTSIREIS